jgi:thiamine biosynthesis protein ThiC
MPGACHAGDARGADFIDLDLHRTASEFRTKVVVCSDTGETPVETVPITDAAVPTDRFILNSF